MAFLAFVIVVAVAVVVVLRSIGTRPQRAARDRRRGTDTDPPYDDNPALWLWYQPWTWGSGRDDDERSSTDSSGFDFGDDGGGGD